METCIITGAGSGIGKAVAIELAKRRMFLKYVLIGRNEEAMAKTVNRMAEYVPTESIFFYKPEFAFPEKLPSLMKQINNEVGDIDCLLNIAGYTDPQSLLSTTLDSFDLTYKVNVFTPFILMRECTK